MGCDIHLFVERRNAECWESCDTWEPNPFHDEGEAKLMVPYDKRFYHGRNYDLFGILANVRNGRGFAGCDLGAGFWPIAPPRGLPADVTFNVHAEAESWGPDGHSHSWLTVRELLEYDWTQVTTQRGVVDPFQFWQWDQFSRHRGAAPQEYVGDVMGAGTRFVSEEEMRQLTKKFNWATVPTPPPPPGFHGVYCRVEWEQPYYKCARDFLGETMPRLWQLGKPEDVRIVFWFDN